MDLHEALRGRRTIQEWEPGELPEGVLERALGAAHQAPNHKRTWPWRFTIVGPVAREALLAANLRLKGEKRPLLPEQVAKVEQGMRVPGAIVAVSQVRSDDPWRSKEDYAACACAIQNLMLSLHGDGFGTKWSTGGIIRDGAVYEALGIDSAVEELVGVVQIGRVGRVPFAERPPLAMVVREVP